jgi:hypothetical protein
MHNRKTKMEQKPFYYSNVKMQIKTLKFLGKACPGPILGATGIDKPPRSMTAGGRPAA